MVSQSQECGARDHSLAATEAQPSVPCDLCGYGMPLPAICAEQGEIRGLLVCTACIEDELAARMEQTL